MNRRIALSLAGLALAALTGCSAAENENLLPGAGDGTGDKATSPDSTAAEGNTFHHMATLAGSDTGGEFQVKGLMALTAPEVAAKLHGCTKIPYATLKTILESRGATLAANAQDVNAAGSLYTNGKSSLGAPNYGARVAEQLFGTTASMAKQFDIHIAASGDIVTNFANSTACKGLALVDADNKVSKDGLSCLIGKPVKDEHVILANDLIGKAATAADGVKLVVSALLSAAHTCE